MKIKTGLKIVIAASLATLSIAMATSFIAGKYVREMAREEKSFSRILEQSEEIACQSLHGLLKREVAGNGRKWQGFGIFLPRDISGNHSNRTCTERPCQHNILILLDLMGCASLHPSKFCQNFYLSCCFLCVSASPREMIFAFCLTRF